MPKICINIFIILYIGKIKTKKKKKKKKNPFVCQTFVTRSNRSQNLCNSKLSITIYFFTANFDLPLSASLMHHFKNLLMHCHNAIDALSDDAVQYCIAPDLDPKYH